MSTRKLLWAAVIAASAALVTVETATAQGMQGQTGSGTMPGGMDGSQRITG